MRSCHDQHAAAHQTYALQLAALRRDSAPQQLHRQQHEQQHSGSSQALRRLTRLLTRLLMVPLTPLLTVLLTVVNMALCMVLERSVLSRPPRPVQRWQRSTYTICRERPVRLVPAMADGKDGRTGGEQLGSHSRSGCDWVVTVTCGMVVLCASQSEWLWA